MKTNLILANKTMSSLEIAELTGMRHADLMRSIRNMEDAWVRVSQRKFTLSSYQQSQPNGGTKTVPCYELTKSESLYVATKFNDEARAKVIIRWEDLESGKAEPIVKNSPQDPRQIGLKDQITWVKEVKKMLNLNDASTLSLLQKVADPFNLPLPDYTPSKGILKSATELLTKRDLLNKIKAHMFNSKAISNGFLCEKVRDSSKGSKKKFKSITEKGLQYGENQVHPNNPKETQPLWYDETFDELLILLGFKISA